MRPEGTRDPVAGPDSGPEAPFPIRLSGPVIKGFGRGSKELGIPTANIPPEGLSAYPDLQTGVYYGVVALDPAKFTYSDDGSTDNGILPCVLSIGYNPFYKNTVRSVEIHILRPLPTPPPTTTNSTTTPTHFHKLPDFYGTSLNLLILGYIRPEYDYVNAEALIEDIRTDCDVARESLKREAYAGYLGGGGDGGANRSEEVKAETEWLKSFS
ncbi:riboflavin kinase [Arachnomyces sp. PD_36]|nr:riboflavin kinase [Arachnomyces sp. PD_36]